MAGSGSPGAPPRGASLGAKLILLSTLLSIVAVGVSLAALSVEVRRQTRRLLAGTLDRHLKTILEVQKRGRQELLRASGLMTQSPMLRAAIETYHSEHVSGEPPRPDLLATIQAEVDRIAGGLDHDLLFVTDPRGVVLAARSRSGAGVVIGADLSSLAPVRKALEEDEAGASTGEFSVASLGERHFQVGCVPIVLQGFVIGALAVGDVLDRRMAERLRESLDSEVLITVAGRPLASTLDRLPAADPVPRPPASEGPPGPDTPIALIDGEEYITAALPLGADAGGPATLYLLHSFSRAVETTRRGLLRTFLFHGALAGLLAGLAAWAVSRSVLRPLERFVEFLRSVADSGDYGRRFQQPVSSLEIRTLNDTYARLMDSLQDEQRRRLRRAQEDLDRMERLRESEKLAALGRMLSGTAHEINNPLTGVIGNVEFLLTSPGLDDPVRSRLEKVRREGRRIVALVRNLLKTAHRDDGERSLIDLSQIARECAAMRLHDFTAAGVRLRLDTAGAPCRVLGSELEMQQVFLNIINNALDALAGRGDDPELVVRTGLADGIVEAEFVDNGPGLKEPQRVFEHFYTTKEVGKGTGLGLSITHAIVEKHAGRIVAGNRPSGGARFLITLPSAPGPAAEAAPPDPTEEGRERPSPPVLEMMKAASVLVVEDEPAVLDLQVSILRSIGARVSAARTGAEALELLGKDDFDLIVTDLKMPGGVSGQDLYRWVVAHRPESAGRFVFVTGDTASEATRSFLAGTRRRAVHKPFTLESYLAALKATFRAACVAGLLLAAATGPARGEDRWRGENRSGRHALAAQVSWSFDMRALADRPR